jgi:hypothetical protein
MLNASTRVHGYDLVHLPILNPGRCGGRTWVMELRGSAPIWVVVEAQSVNDALLVHADDPDFGEAVYVAHVLDDDSPDDDSGRCLTTHRVRVYGEPGDDPPYLVKYHGIGYPRGGIDPRRLAASPLN